MTSARREELRAFGLTLGSLAGLAVALSGGYLVFLGHTGRFRGGDPGYANLLAIAAGLCLVFFGGLSGARRARSLSALGARWRRRGRALSSLNGGAVLSGGLYLALLLAGALG
jgi:hypothetical protein